MKLKYVAGERDGERKIYHILRNELNITATTLKRLKAAGGIYLNGEPAFTTVRLSSGDVVEADVSLSERETAVTPEEGSLSVLLERPGWLAVNKPCGMLVHPSRAKADGTLLGLAAGYLLKTGQDPQCHVVNRLDRDTSGVVLIAKTAHHKALLAEALSRDAAAKEYTAILSGVVTPEEGMIDAPIMRKEPRAMARCVHPDGKPARTGYKTLSTAETPGGLISLVRFRLYTGRTHQIRVHSAYMGAPLLGDKLYASEQPLELSQRLGITAQALHAEKLTFSDPETGEPLAITAPLEREDMLSVIDLYF